jgi:hypothetical protein
MSEDDKAYTIYSLSSQMLNSNRSQIMRNPFCRQFFPVQKKVARAVPENLVPAGGAGLGARRAGAPRYCGLGAKNN